MTTRTGRTHHHQKPYRWLLLAILLGLAPLPAAAQVRGVVVDAQERPLPRVIVELWDGDARTAATETDERGRFGLGGGAGPGPFMLTARRVGLRTQAVQVTSTDTALVLRMEARPVALAPLTVAAAPRRICPNREDPAARALWERMRGRYWQPTMDSVFVFSFMETRSGVAAKADVDRPEVGRTRTGWTTSSLVHANPRFMHLSGYATRASGGAGERTAFWHYRALDQGGIQDFTGEYFGAVHTFSIVDHDPARPVIGFCPRGRPRDTGQIEGALVLRPDTTLGEARWTFRTPRPDEDAGGEASYYPPNPGLGNALLARESLFWRKTNPPHYYFESHAFTAWHPRRR
ncbi:MAG TPA: carboxypeptidase regulatory-like domain-containing protein [Longimicrobium sp.]|nr:carboxypeptidase regulatory-like domain-containing protein [Longimicrobium sp.]